MRALKAQHWAVKMAMLGVRSISDELHGALRTRSAERGHSMEGEVRETLESTVRPARRVKLGSSLAEMGWRAKLTDDACAVFDKVRNLAPPLLQPPGQR